MHIKILIYDPYCASGYLITARKEDTQDWKYFAASTLNSKLANCKSFANQKGKSPLFFSTFFRDGNPITMEGGDS